MRADTELRTLKGCLGTWVTGWSVQSGEGSPINCGLYSVILVYLLLSLPLSERQYPILQMQTLRFQKETDLPKDPKQDEKLNLTINPFHCQTAQSPGEALRHLLGSSSVSCLPGMCSREISQQTKEQNITQ